MTAKVLSDLVVFEVLSAGFKLTPNGTGTRTRHRQGDGFLADDRIARR